MDGMPIQWPDRYPPLLVDVGNKIVHRLRMEGISRERAIEVALAITGEVLVEWGGQQPYIPSGARIEAAARAAEVRARYTGDNIAELAREYHLNPRRIRQIVCGGNE